MENEQINEKILDISKDNETIQSLMIGLELIFKQIKSVTDVHDDFIKAYTLQLGIMTDVRLIGMRQIKELNLDIEKRRMVCQKKNIAN